MYDACDTIFELWSTGPSDADLLRTEGQRSFGEVLSAVAWPALHVTVGGALYSAWSPELGRVDFPPETAYAQTADASGIPRETRRHRAADEGRHMY